MQKAQPSRHGDSLPRDGWALFLGLDEAHFPPRMFTYTANNEQDTDRLGHALASVLPPGTVIALTGTLGAGKTRLVQAVAAACGVAREAVTSPTFVLVNEYTTGRLPIYHFDTYRLRDDDEFLNLGPDEYFDGRGLTFVEWADRVAALLPAERIEISIDVVGESMRRFSVRGTTARMEEIVSRIKVDGEERR